MSNNLLDYVGLGYFLSKIKTLFVTGLGTSGNSLTWTKNGTTNNVTVPYATKSSELVPLQTKQYTGVIGTANNNPGAVFYFMSIHPDDWNKPCRVVYKISAEMSGQTAGKAFSIISIVFSRNTAPAYDVWNYIGHTDYRPYYYHYRYLMTSTGHNNNYGHLMGIGLNSSYSPTSATYARDFKIEVLEATDCTVTLFDTMTKYANVPGTGSTNYSGETTYNATTLGETHSGDINDVNYQNREYYGCRKTNSALYRYTLCLTKSDGSLVPLNSVNNTVATTKELTSDSFDPFGEIFYWNSTATYSAGTNVGDGSWYRQILFDARYSFNTGGYSATGTLVARSPVYLVAVPRSDGTAVLNSTPLALALPTEDDGLIYIYLGRVYPDNYPYRISLSLNHPVYYYKNGAVRLWTNEQNDTDVVVVCSGNNYGSGVVYTFDKTFAEITLYIKSGKRVWVYNGDNAVPEEFVYSYSLFPLRRATLSYISFASDLMVWQIDNNNAVTCTYITYESTDNKVTSISSSSTDTLYPSAKAVYDLCQLSSLSKDHLTFIALNSGTITFTGSTTSAPNVISYSINNGQTWTTPANSVTINVNAEDKILWKGEMTPLTDPDASITGVGKFGGTASFNVEGNVNSLLYGDNFEGQHVIGQAFMYLFENSNIVSAKNLILDTTTATDCYGGMFSKCASLIEAPELPATTLAQYCYYLMFRLCTALTKAPLLLAEVLAANCYTQMFDGCTSLTQAPELSATTLTNNCYSNMFSGCTSLTTAPELPATTLANYCYSYMFKGCTNLNYIKMLATDISATNCLNNWVQNVANSGIFVKATSMTTLPNGNNGIPTGWQVYTEEEYKEVRHYELNNAKPFIITATGTNTITADKTSTEVYLAYLDNRSIYLIYQSLVFQPINITSSNIVYSCILLEGSNLVQYIIGHSGTSITVYEMSNLEKTSNKVTSISSSSTDTQYPSAKLVYTQLNTKENTSNKVTSLSVSSTNTQYPSAKAVYDNINNKHSKDYLTFEVLESGTINFTPTSGNENIILYSKDNGITWTLGSSVSVNVGDRVMWKGSGFTPVNSGTGGIGTFGDASSTSPVTTIKFKVYGNIMSLVYDDNFENQTEFAGAANFCCLFKETKVTEAHNLILPNTNLVERCYNKMFMDCAELISMPDLHGIVLAKHCYSKMFDGCTKLYYNIPEVLPVTTLAINCYDGMFINCSSMVVAPKLPATVLANSCYSAMFLGCSNLEVAPELPAAVFTPTCSWRMFDGCAKLKFIKCLATDISASNSHPAWTTGVGANGIFVKADNPPAWPSGVNGIPTSWTSYTESLWKEVRHYELSSKEDTTNKVTSLSASSTDTQYPSAKCVYDAINNINPRIPITNHGTSNTTFALTPNIYHKWGNVSSLTLTLATPDDASVMNEYIFSFTSPATPTTLSLPASVKWVTALDIEPSKLYRVSIIDNLATWITSDMVVPIGDVNTPEFATKAYVDAGLALKENSSNKVTSVDENSTDTLYPSAKAMYDALNPS